MSEITSAQKNGEATPQNSPGVTENASAILATSTETPIEANISKFANRPLENEHEQWRQKSAYLFKWHILTQLMTNAAEGVIPCLLVFISNKFGMSTAQTGLLGGLYYISWACAGLFVGHIIKRQEQGVKRFYLGSLMLSIICVTVLGLLPASAGPWPMICVQAICGIVVSGPAVIGAVWVDVFSNSETRTSRMGLFQGCMVLGAGFGYGLSALLSNMHNSYLDPYQIALLVIAGLQLIIFWFLLVTTTNEDFDTNSAARRLEGPNPPRRNVDILRTLMQIMCNIKFMLGIITLSNIFFIVRGVQYYATSYFIQVFKANETTVYWAFFWISLSAPLLGLAMGSSVGDCVAEYFDNQPSSTIRFYGNVWCCVFGVCSCFWACIAAMSDEFVLVAVALWFCLFFGAAMIPMLTVTVLKVLPVSQRPVAQGFQNFLIGIIGYGGSLIGLGFIAKIGMKFMWKVLLQSSWICLIFLALMTCSLNDQSDDALDSN